MGIVTWRIGDAHLVVNSIRKLSVCILKMANVSYINCYINVVTSKRYDTGVLFQQVTDISVHFLSSIDNIGGGGGQ